MATRLDDVRDDLIARLPSVIGDAIADLEGLVLFTDDDVSTLFHTVCTRTWLAEAQDSDLAYQPSDWPPPLGDGLAAASALLAELAAADSSPAAADDRFEALVGVLEQLRETGSVGDGVFLAVLSSDPSEHTEALGDDAVRRLNSDDRADAYLAWVGQWRV